MIEKLKKWQKMSNDLKTLKEKEAKLRIELCSEFLKNKVPPCKNKFEYEGFEIEAVRGVSFKLDESVVNQIYPDLPDEEKNAINFKPALKLREYKKLPESAMLREAVTMSPAMPTLKIKDAIS
jgi:hypothetical protein